MSSLLLDSICNLCYTPLFVTIKPKEEEVVTNQETYARMRGQIAGQTTDNLFWLLQLILIELGFDSKARINVPRKIMEVIRTVADECVAAERIWEIIGGQSHVVAERLKDRASLVHSQISEWILGKSILDFGCGDGRIAALIADDQHDVLMYDVDDYREDVVKQSQIAFADTWSVVEQGAFDTSLALTVFHHCAVPCEEIKRLATVSRRVIVIESILTQGVPWHVQTFIDWLYNRCMHPGAQIPVPGNFMTPSGWKGVFADCGFSTIHEEALGIDVPIVPEFHHLFVLERT